MPIKITKIRKESTLPKKVEWRSLPWQKYGAPGESMDNMSRIF